MTEVSKGENDGRHHQTPSFATALTETDVRDPSARSWMRRIVGLRLRCPEPTTTLKGRLANAAQPSVHHNPQTDRVRELDSISHNPASYAAVRNDHIK
jgi:hypothetical protein